MKITFLKSGKFSIHPVVGPIISCVKDEVKEIDDKHGKILIDANWAERKTRLSPPWLKLDWDGDNEDAKDILQDYALRKYNHRVSKRKSVRNMIVEIKNLMS